MSIDRRHRTTVTSPRARGLRRLAVTGALGLGLALVPVQMAGASTSPGPEESIEVDAATPCKYQGKEYTKGAVEKHADGQLYVCQEDGSWKIKAN